MKPDLWNITKQIFSWGWGKFKSLFKNPKLVIGLCSFTFALGMIFMSFFKIEFSITPEDQRNGWINDTATIQAAGQGIPDIEIKGATESSDGARVYLWEFVKQINNGEHFPTFRQETGDCVSMGASNAVNYLQAVQIAKGDIGLQFHHAFQPYIYGISRTKPECGNGKLGRGAGSVGGWAAKGLTLYGALAGDHEGVPNYSGSLADQWGYKGVPKTFVDHAREFKVKSYAKVTSYEQARDALANGYPVTVASNQGFRMKPKEHQGKMWGIPSGSWSHQMCFVGVDDQAESPRGDIGGLYILNSWGANAHGQPAGDEPPGGFWVDKKTVNRMLRQNDSYAFSSFDGFPAQDLNFHIFGAEKTDVINVDIEDVPKISSIPAITYYTGIDEKTGIGFGTIWFVLSTAWSIYEFWKGRKKPVKPLPNPFSTAVIMAMFFIPPALNAAELEFNVFDSGEKPATQVDGINFINVFDSASQKTNCQCGENCDCIGVCTCGEICKCPKKKTSIRDDENPCIGMNCFDPDQGLEAKQEPARPVIFVYKDLNTPCPPCDVLKSQEADLPYEFIWKQAPSWVTAYPTLHWNGADGKGRQIIGWGPGSKKSFPEAYQATQQPAKKTERIQIIDDGKKRFLR